MKIVAITACGAGIAHTYMAAEGLKVAAKDAGYEIKIEIQGAMGIEDELSQEEIDDADLVIFAVDIGVRKVERFNNKKVYKTGPHEAIVKAKEVIESAQKFVGK